MLNYLIEKYNFNLKSDPNNIFLSFIKCLKMLFRTFKKKLVSGDKRKFTNFEINPFILYVALSKSNFEKISKKIESLGNKMTKVGFTYSDSKMFILRIINLFKAIKNN